MDDKRDTPDAEGSESESIQQQGCEEFVGDEPVGADNIRDGTVRGTMHGGSTKAGGQGQGG
jgi:hypothetical protein